MAEGLDALLKPVGSRGGRRGWAREGLGPSPPWGTHPTSCPCPWSSGLRPASQVVWASSMHGPLASHLQITLVVGLDHLRCCTTKSLPPIMEPE